MKKFKGQLQVGSLDSKKPEAKPAAEPMPVAVPKKPVAKAAAKPKAGEEDPIEPFGEQIPFSDPNWYQGVSRALRYYRPPYLILLFCLCSCCTTRALS